ISYSCNGKYAKRDLSERSLRAFSTDRIPLSARTWMKGSTTVPGGDAVALGQHKSKSPCVITLESTNSLCIVLRPSSTSVWTVLPLAACLVSVMVSPDFLTLGSGGASIGKLLAL